MTPAASRTLIGTTFRVGVLDIATAPAPNATSVDLLSYEVEGGEPLELELLVYPDYTNMPEATRASWGRGTWGVVQLDLKCGKGVPGSGGEHETGGMITDDLAAATALYGLPNCGVRTRVAAKWLRLTASVSRAINTPDWSVYLVASLTPTVGGMPARPELDAVFLLATEPIFVAGVGGAPGHLEHSTKRRALVPKGAQSFTLAAWDAAGGVQFLTPGGDVVGTVSTANSIRTYPVPRGAYWVRFVSSVLPITGEGGVVISTRHGQEVELTFR
jgi:hypothetical protein